MCFNLLMLICFQIINSWCIFHFIWIRKILHLDNTSSLFWNTETSITDSITQICCHKEVSRSTQKKAIILTWRWQNYVLPYEFFIFLRSIKSCLINEYFITKLLKNNTDSGPNSSILPMQINLLKMSCTNLFSKRCWSGFPCGWVYVVEIQLIVTYAQASAPYFMLWIPLKTSSHSSTLEL